MTTQRLSRLVALGAACFAISAIPAAAQPPEQTRRSEPIYGYNNLDPGQVIENVQLALRDQGYYPGAIDGVVGTQTRAALAAFQRDKGLIITSAVDQPTLVTLGLT